MRTIIAGSRNCTDYALLEEAIKECGWLPSVVISGNAKGADTLGEIWAENNDVPYELYPAKWNLYGRSAGPRRNEEMSEVAEALIALWDGQSRGTKHMIETARKKGLRCYIKSTINNPSLLNLI